LWDNPEFIQARFHIEWFITTAIDTEADRDNIKALYSCLKSTLAQIDVSALKNPLLHLLGMDLTPSLRRSWKNILKTRISF
jgi:hypothetical protein